jgi:hypothetical protein
MILPFLSHCSERKTAAREAVILRVIFGCRAGGCKTAENFAKFELVSNLNSVPKP